MKNRYKILFLIPAFAMVNSCSTKKDTGFSRNLHALATKYNVLFNGNVAFKEGITEINSQYKDDYWQQLPLEPLKFKEKEIVVSFSGPGGGFNKNKNTKKQTSKFDRAEEKAVKAIQMHSMNINGREKNRQIDDAYLLLGKSRYYSQRFIPAIEAFNYLIENYPYAGLIGETKIWRAKANLRIENEKLAIESLKLLLEIKKGKEYFLSEKVKEQAHTALAMAYIQTDSIEKAKNQLFFATETFHNKEQSARNMFVLGQIYSKQQKKDSAVLVFEKLKNIKKAPYKYRIHATIELAKNTSKDSSSVALLLHFKKLIKNTDNRLFYGELYYQMGFLEEKNDSINAAIVYYNKSLRSKHVDDIQKSYSYTKLGDIFFAKDNYKSASSYYDSVLQVSKESKELRIRRVKRKHQNLASLIKFEEIVRLNDSILRIAAMSSDKQKSYFETYIKKIKKEDEEKRQQQLNAIAFGGSFGGNSLQSTKKGEWYFYNSQVANFGKTEFQKTWGNRALEDNWRWENKLKSVTTKKDSSSTKQLSDKYDIAFYINKIPTKKVEIDNLQNQRNNALYELGLIYKEQFKNTKLAIKRLERVLPLNTDEELILPINYHLYQLYIKTGNTYKATIHKNVIVTNYAETSFAHNILHPNIAFVAEETTNETENIYKEIYYLYKENKFEKVVKEIDKILPTLTKSKIIPKFVLLKAYAIGKYYDKKTYKRFLNYVVEKYPKTAEGIKAKEIVNQLK